MPERLDHLERVLLGEGQVIIGVDQQHLLPWSAGFRAGDLGVIAARANGRPQGPQTVLRKAGFLERLLYVAGALPRPGHVAEGRRGVVEDVHPDARVVCAGQKRIAGAQAGPQHAEVFVALLLQPIQAAPDIDHRLPAGHDRPPDVGAPRVV